MEDKLNAIVKEVGRPYNMFFKDGNYEGCFYPIYKVYPHLPTYPLPSMDRHKENYVYAIKQILKHFKKVDNPIKGDMMACEFNGALHVGIMLDSERVINIFKGRCLQVNRLRVFKDCNLSFYRLVK